MALALSLKAASFPKTCRNKVVFSCTVEGQGKEFQNLGEATS